jgi:CheY-like chemotaxis protein/HPt (histidine-containing phosphotransfer) domain-containing protein
MAASDSTRFSWSRIPVHLESSIQALRQEYVEELLVQTRDLVNRWTLALQNPGRLGQTLQDLRHSAHRLRGGATAFNFGQVEQAAASLEEAIDSLPPDQLPYSLSPSVHIGHLITRLRQAALATQREQSDRFGLPASTMMDGRPGSPEECDSMSSGKLILIVDDHALLRRKLRLVFQARGFRVAEAENGFEAIEQAHRCRPDLILMDIRMPLMDGLEAQRLIRMDSELMAIPIIFLSSISSITIGEINLATRVGLQGYLSKTVRTANIVEKVESWFSNAA